jgi:hypothetical protein
MKRRWEARHFLVKAHLPYVTFALIRHYITQFFKGYFSLSYRIPTLSNWKRLPIKHDKK